MKHLNRKLRAVALILCVMPMLSGCYLAEVVEPNEVVAQVDGGQVTGVAGPGVYTNLGPFAGLVKVSSNTLVIATDDPEVATLDNQLVGISVTVQMRRNTSEEAVRDLMKNWRSVATNDEAFGQLVQPMVLQAVKVGTKKFTLQDLLADRNGLATSIQTDLQTEATKFDSTVVAVQVANVSMDPRYADQLQQKALLLAQAQTALQQQAVISQTAANAILQAERNRAIAQEQLLVEQANTQVQLEIATRQGKITAAQNAVYQTNPQAFELAALDKYARIFGQGTVYFVPVGTPLNLILGPVMSGTQPLPIHPTGVITP